jgi:glyoxylase-like metal-dependent hydrolase (beta-lactamase superfamily II)/rhodanese-related sulfurtransferase
MAEQVEVAELRRWLQEGRPVTVLDVRLDEDRAQWSIPGSIHVNAYEALKANQSDVFSGLQLPPDVPVVTVCNRGIVSETAAKLLAERGVPASSLRGGMQAWSLAWNTAEMNLSQMHVTQVRRTGKGCLSYLLSSGDDAIVIDASLEPELYEELSERRGVHIRYVLDTHLHADHLSRAKRLAEVTGSDLWLPQQDRVKFSYRALLNGSELYFGKSVLQAISTPGHTSESTCYFVDKQALFTGDTLFLSGVGRPDLHASSSQAKERADQLYRSLKTILALDPAISIFPGHTSEPVPFDGEILTSRLGLVALHLREWLVSPDIFRFRILSRIPPTPPNYALITGLNVAGELPDGDIAELEAGANRCAVN